MGPLSVPFPDPYGTYRTNPLWLNYYMIISDQIYHVGPLPLRHSQIPTVPILQPSST